MRTISRHFSYRLLLGLAAIFVVLPAGRPRAEAAAPAFSGGIAQSGQASMAAGDATRGKALVQSSGCFDCHRIGDQGSRMGPDLSDIGARRTPERLRQALLDPDEEVLAENRFVRFVTKDGA